MNVKDNRRVRMTRQLIKDALIDLLDEKDFSKITVKELCQYADINRSTFYLHYEDQYALMEEVENDIINKTPRINLYDNDDIYQVLVDFFDFIMENKKYYLVLFRSTVGNSFRNKVLDKVFGKDEHKKVWISNMNLQNETHFKMLMYAFGGVSLIEKWIFGEISGTSEEIAGALAKFVKSGGNGSGYQR